MTLYSDFLEWQARMQALLEEGQELAQRINEQENQNVSLQRRLLSKEDAQPSGFDMLSDLYDEGYHICPADFGHQREDDCLFCLNFLHHKGNKE